MNKAMCIYTHTLCTSEKHVSPDFLNIACSVFLKISRLAARVLVTDIKHWYRHLYYEGEQSQELGYHFKRLAAPGGMKDAKTKSKPKRSDLCQRAHNCTSVAKSSWWKLSCYSRTKMLNLLILSTWQRKETHVYRHRHVVTSE